MIVNLTIEEDCTEIKATKKSRIISESNIDLLSGITSRRSIRDYTGQEINEEHLNTILNAGFCAPSAKNKRPWHFIVLQNKDKLNAISLMGTNNSMISKASCCIVVCGDKVKQGINELLIEDCSAATQNMLLATHGLGLGGVWCGIIKNSDTYKYLKNVLKLPESINPISIVVLGYPNEVKSEVARFEEGKIHREVWNNR